MARVDGEVTHDEVEAFQSFFHVPPGEEKNVQRFFDLAKRDASGFEPYARQVAALFPDAPEVLENVLEGLFDRYTDAMCHGDFPHCGARALGLLQQLGRPLVVTASWPPGAPQLQRLGGATGE